MLNEKLPCFASDISLPPDPQLAAPRQQEVWRSHPGEVVLSSRAQYRIRSMITRGSNVGSKSKPPGAPEWNHR